MGSDIQCVNLMFNPVRTRLTILYTCSFFALLLIFIFLLFYFITNSIEQQQKEKLLHYFEEEHDDFVEDIKKGKKKKVKFTEGREIFYYLYNAESQLVKGRESILGFYNDLDEMIDGDPASSFTKKIMNQEAHLLILKVPIERKGTMIGFVIIGTNITNEIHLMERIVWILISLTIVFGLLLAILSHYLAGRAMKPIQRAFERQKQFVSDASHELRTPLSIFYSTLELLEREEKDKMSPFAQEVLTDMKLEASLMNQLIENLLTIARDDQNQLTIEKEMVNVSELIQSLGKRFSMNVPSHLQFQLDVEKDISLEVDPIRIQQLVYILLDNALLYTDKGLIKLTLKRKNGHIYIEVSDTGQGIKKEDVKHIFERFYRGDKSRVRDGTGLGLSIAQLITKLHGGKMEVTSEVGQGSVFTVILPEK